MSFALEARMEEMPIRRGDWADEECVGALLSVSFTDDPFVRWLLPRPRDATA
jgi:hypothetical protein